MNSVQYPASCSAVGKRKRHQDLVLQLSGGSCESDIETASDFSINDEPTPSSSRAETILINGKLIKDNKRRYHCTYLGCMKTYKKPSRLEEHERTHSGERPFVCFTCNKSYFRDSHLQAHTRSHLPETSRPFVCTVENCKKRFWTSQHLKRHNDMHTGEKPFKCIEPGCTLAFSKHHQLRSHISMFHCPPGTMPFLCTSANCTKSFPTNQKLKAHMRTHEGRRYICSHPDCIKNDQEEIFTNWSALQLHTRSVHPAICPYPSCKGKIFSQQKGLRAHMKLHEQHEVEESLLGEPGEIDDENEHPVKRRRGGEVGRDWRCAEIGCEKDFKSKKALAVHVRVFHMKRRDFICPSEACNASFGYKHLMQRHVAKVHSANDGNRDMIRNDVSAPEDCRDADMRSAINILTGKAYADDSELRIQTQNALHCPYHSLSSTPRSTSTGKEVLECLFVFTRAYNLRRHLSSVHHLEIDKQQALDIATAMRQGKNLLTNV